MLGSVTGISWASFTIASSVERGCFCLEEQHERTMINRAENLEMITATIADKVNSKV